MTHRLLLCVAFLGVGLYLVLHEYFISGGFCLIVAAAGRSEL
jgi:hypothetical protein